MTRVVRVPTMEKPPSDRWYEASVRRTPPLGRDEEQRCVAALEAHRVVVARDVLGGPIGLRYLREIAQGLESRRIDVRSVVETEADVRVEDARAECLARLERIARLTASHRPLSARARTQLEREIRDLGLRRSHVDTVVARMEAVRPTTAKTLARLRVAAEDAARGRARLVESHLRLVTALARRYADRGLELPDLVQEGTIGLMRAADRFDVRHQVTFATYAAWWVRQTIGRAMTSRARTVRLPGSVEEGLRKIRRHRRHLTLEKCRLPTTAELADATRLSEDRVDDLERIEHDLCRPMIPFDAPAQDDDDDGRAPADMLADQHWPNPEDATVARRLVAHASDALGVLAPREREVIQLRYGIDRDREHTLEDIGKEFGLTRQRILQIASKALEKLRTSRHARQLQAFWKP